MRNALWLRLLRNTSLAALMTVIGLGSSVALAIASGEKPAGPIQDFDWLYKDSLLKDDDKNDDDDAMEAGDVIIEERRTTTTTTTTVTQTRYTDLSPNYWADTFIYRLSAIDVVKGFPGGVFLPNNYLTKAQYAAMVARSFDMPATRQIVVINNVSQNYWAYRDIQKAVTMGFIDLDGGTFDVEGSLTRLEMLVWLARGLNITEVTSEQSVEELLSIFSDADDIPSEYRVIIAALVERGILVNYPQLTELNLFEVVTRAEACGFVYQALAYLGSVEQVESVYIVNSANFASLETITIQETVTTTETSTVDVDYDDDDDDDDRRQNCNQGIGNGAEGCDPGHSAPHGGSNDETGRTPGNPNR
jgi:hypothetical protein